jgi:hypothetical protein
MEWRKNKIKEIKIVLNNSNKIKEVEVIARPKNNNDQTTEHTADECGTCGQNRRPISTYYKTQTAQRFST